MESDTEESSAALCERKQEQKWEKFYSKLQDFPNSFLLERDHREMEKVQLKKLSKGLQYALRAGYETALETARAKNYLAFLLACQGKLRNALALTREAGEEEGEQRNLVSLANRAIILWREGHRQEAEAEIVKLKSLKTDHAVDFGYLRVKAKAELAFACSRMGPRFLPKAVAIFEDVLKVAREPEKWLWTFGMGLCRRRSLHLLHSPLFREHDAAMESAKAMEAFQDVISNADSCNLKAKTYAEIAVLIGRMVWDPQEKKRLAKMAGGWPQDLCKKALELDDNDNSVLCKAGRILRQCDRVDNFTDLPFDGPVDLFKRALRIRPSSTAFHHLGLKYKAMAREAAFKEEKRKQEKSNYFSYIPKILLQVCNYIYVLLMRRVFGKAQFEASQTRQSHADRHNNSDRRPPSNIFKLAQAIKSPTNVIPLSKSDHLVSQAMACFQKAYKFSERTNLHSLYDLALMHRYVGEPEEALRRLEELRHRNQTHLNYLTVNAFEQTGLILVQKSKIEEDKLKKKELICEAEPMFYRALETAVQLYSKNPHTKGCIGEIWHSFLQLIKSVDDSKLPETEKLLKKAELFLQISDSKQSQRLLQQLRTLQPSSQKEPPGFLKICIKTHVKLGETEKALALIEVLSRTPKSREIIKDLFGDRHYIEKLHLRAAKKALLSNALLNSQEHFRAVFSEIFKYGQLQDGQDSANSSSAPDKDEPETWDMMIIFSRPPRPWTCTQAEEVRKKPDGLAGILRTACGLKVTVMDEDVLKVLNQGPWLNCMYDIMRRSSVVVVLVEPRRSPGPTSNATKLDLSTRDTPSTPESDISAELSLLIDQTLHHKRTTTFTLLTEADACVPDILQPYPSVLCPEEIFQSYSNDTDNDMKYSQEAVSGICQLFRFLFVFSQNRTRTE